MLFLHGGNAPVHVAAELIGSKSEFTREVVEAVQGVEDVK